MYICAIHCPGGIYEEFWPIALKYIGTLSETGPRHQVRIRNVHALPVLTVCFAMINKPMSSYRWGTSPI